MADATDNHEAAAAAPPAEPAPALPSMSGGTVIASQLATMLAQVGKTVTDRTTTIRSTCDLIDQTLAEDADRIKNELTGYVAGAEAMAQQCDGMQKLLDNMRANRAKRVGSVT